MCGTNPVTSKKQLFITNVKVFEPLTVVEKRLPLDVAGFLNPTGFQKPFSSIAGFLNLPMVILSLKHPLREKCPNTEVFLVHIFSHSD